MLLKLFHVKQLITKNVISSSQDCPSQGCIRDNVAWHATKHDITHDM